MPAFAFDSLSQCVCVYIFFFRWTNENVSVWVIDWLTARSYCDNLALSLTLIHSRCLVRMHHDKLGRPELILPLMPRTSPSSFGKSLACGLHCCRNMRRERYFGYCTADFPLHRPEAALSWLLNDLLCTCQSWDFRFCL